MRVQNAIYTEDTKKTQSVAFTASAAVSSATLPDQCYAVRVYASVDCRISLDGSAAAEKTGTTNGSVTSGLSMFLPAEQTEYFAFQGKDTISVIGVSASGTLDITPMTE